MSTSLAKTLNALRQLLQLHYITNICLALSYLILKSIPIVCSTLFETCRLEWREYEILIFVAVVIVLKTRKTATWLQYVEMACTFAKCANLILFWREGPLHEFVFLLLWVLHILFLPEPSYAGPDRITYFRGPNLEHEIEREASRSDFLVCFYAPWSPPCVQFASVFAQLSNQYGDLKALRFAKFDVSKFADVAKKFRIDASAISHQLPTVVLFQNGREVRRRPIIDVKGQVQRFIFSEANMITDFGLNDLYGQAKERTKVPRQPATATAAEQHTKSE